MARTWSDSPRAWGDAAAGDGTGRDLTYSVIDSTGTVRWRAIRPATCTGFALSTAGGRPIVVLTDADVSAGARDGGSDGGRWQTTASAYDLATGDEMWGPDGDRRV